MLEVSPDNVDRAAYTTALSNPGLIHRNTLDEVCTPAARASSCNTPSMQDNGR